MSEVVEALSGAGVEPFSDDIAAVLRDAGHTRALGQVLADEAVSVLRRTAFPGMVRGGEEKASAALSFDALIGVEESAREAGI